MDRAEVISILEEEVREAKGVAKVQAIKLLLEEYRRDGNEDAKPVKSKIVELAERRAARAG